MMSGSSITRGSFGIGGQGVEYRTAGYGRDVQEFNG